MEGLIWVSENLHGSSFFNYIMKFFTMIGDKGIIWLAIAVILLCFKRTRKCGVFLIIVVAISWVVSNIILKNVYYRARPFTENQVMQDFLNSINLTLPDGSSFPSGHAAASFASAIFLTLNYKKNACWAYPLAVIIAFSRIFMCVHYPTDVLAGAIIGTIIGLVIYALMKAFNKGYDKYKEVKKQAKNENN